jgi:hypothetical protein
VGFHRDQRLELYLEVDFIDTDSPVAEMNCNSGVNQLSQHFILKYILYGTKLDLLSAYFLIWDELT